MVVILSIERAIGKCAKRGRLFWRRFFWRLRFKDLLFLPGKGAFRMALFRFVFCGVEQEAVWGVDWFCLWKKLTAWTCLEGSSRRRDWWRWGGEKVLTAGF